MTIKKSILKKEGAVKAGQKRGLVFDKTIRYIKEFYDDLPVLNISQPHYKGPSKASNDDDDDDDDDIVYWWEKDDDDDDGDGDGDAWYKRKKEWSVRGYQWDDVSDPQHAKYRTDAMDGLLDMAVEEWEEVSTSSDDDDDDDDDEESSSSGSGTSDSYEEETVSDIDDEYQMKSDDVVQLDIAHLAAVQSEQEKEDAAQEEEEPAGAEPEPEPEPVVVSNQVDEPPVTPQSVPKPRAVSSPTIDANATAAASLSPKSPATVSIKSEDSEKPSPARARPKRTSRSNSFLKRDGAATPMLGTDSPIASPSAGLLKETNKPAKQVELPENPPLATASPPAQQKPKVVSPRKEQPPSLQKETAEPHRKMENVEVVQSVASAPLLPKKSDENRETSKASSAHKHITRKSSNGSTDSQEKKEKAEKKAAKKAKQRRTSNPSSTSPVHTRTNAYDDDDDDSLNKHEWEKPEWTKENKLKQTKTGRLVRKGHNLAKPITMINRVKNDMADAKLLSFGKPSWTKNKQELLKATKAGEILGKGGDNLARKITHIASEINAACNDDNDDDDNNNDNNNNNLSGNDSKLRSNNSSNTNLAWEKPEWAKKKVIKTTSESEKLKSGASLSKPITHIAKEVAEGVSPEISKLAWEKPEWAKKKVVKSTEFGEKVQKGENISCKITNIKDEAEERGIGWQKPSWATDGPKLKSTPKGQKLKEGHDNLARPITFPKGKGK